MGVGFTGVCMGLRLVRRMLGMGLWCRRVRIARLRRMLWRVPGGLGRGPGLGAGAGGGGGFVSSSWGVEQYFLYINSTTGMSYLVFYLW